MNEKGYEMAWWLLQYKIHFRAKGYWEAMKNEYSTETSVKLLELIEVLNEMVSIKEEMTTAGQDDGQKVQD